MTEVVSSVLGPTVHKLASLAFEDIQLVWGIKDDREKLKSTLEMIQEVLVDAEQKQTKEPTVRHWLLNLNNFCYDVEDVLEEFEIKVSWKWARPTEHLTRKVCYLSSGLPNFIFQFKMAHKMKELRKRLDGINEEKDKFKLSSGIYEKTITLRRESYSSVLPSYVIGRNEEKERIIKLLIGSDDDKAGMITVVPIIGMGGIGKTTLARLVYDDDKVNEHFKKNKVWLSMSLEFEIEKIIRDIIKCLSGEAKFDDWSFEMLKNHLRTVEKKRCLLVMDNVWTVKREDWLKLKSLLRGISIGSKVIVTSRNREITKIMGTVPSINLAILSQEDSLTLFMNCAFDQGQEKNHLDLIVIGKEIVSKCGGNPKALETLGSLLYSENDNRSYWEYVRDSEMWKSETDILPSLRISYDLMPSFLKKCFAYCSIFPKNHKFINIYLIQLWVSNGLIQSSEDKELEEIGQQYLEMLFSRSFFHVVDDDYPFLTFKMHELIYELASSVTQTESSNLKVWTQNISPMTRHISFPNPSGVPKDELSDYLSRLSSVRTIMCEGLGSSNSEEFFLETCILRCKRLRALWLEGSSFDLLPSSIGGLKHLRFLRLRNNCNIKKLPKSICKLLNLQMLDLYGCMELEELPANIKKMIKLRVLTITTKQQRFPKGGIECLTSLRWLWILWCNNLEGLFDDIQSLQSLRKLWIRGCPKLASLPQGIKNLKALKDLQIFNCKNLRLPEDESNEPHSMPSLQSFIFEFLPQIASLPGWLEGSASTLQIIRIASCPNLSVLPEWLQNCSSLTTLEIEYCPRLSSLPDGVRNIPTLKKLWIHGCEGIVPEILN